MKHYSERGNRACVPSEAESDVDVKTWAHFDGVRMQPQRKRALNGTVVHFTFKYHKTGLYDSLQKETSQMKQFEPARRKLLLISFTCSWKVGERGGNLVMHGVSAEQTSKMHLVDYAGPLKSTVGSRWGSVSIGWHLTTTVFLSQCEKVTCILLLLLISWKQSQRLKGLKWNWRTGRDDWLTAGMGKGWHLIRFYKNKKDTLSQSLYRHLCLYTSPSVYVWTTTACTCVQWCLSASTGHVWTTKTLKSNLPNDDVDFPTRTKCSSEPERGEQQKVQSRWITPPDNHTASSLHSALRARKKAERYWYW